ncbi:MAG: hypothetical protein Q8P82_02205 [bacterium]|nr:hypothetical protein [bacterium]
MITDADIKSYLRDLVYLEEEVLKRLENSSLPERFKNRIRDNVVEKQIMVTKIVALFVHDAPH